MTGGRRPPTFVRMAVEATDTDPQPAGSLPEPESEVGENGTHRFDAGNLGCADGLAGEFRGRIGGIPIGDLLVVTARDPAAKEDLPALARLMGHAVRSIETPGDGRLQVTVERRR